MLSKDLVLYAPIMIAKNLSENELEHMHWLRLYFQLPSIGVEKAIPSEDEARSQLGRVRWPNGPVCPKCQSTSVGYHEAREIFACRVCRYQFTVTTGTILHSTKLMILLWFIEAEAIIVNQALGKKNLLILEKVQRRLGISYTSAYRARKTLNSDLVPGGTGLF